MEQNTLPEIIETFSSFIQLLSSIRSEAVNNIPFEGSWTAAQVGEHVHLSASRLLQTIQGEGVLTTREPDTKIAVAESLFMNFDTKFKSPDFIVPAEGPYNKPLLVESLKEDMRGLIDAATHADLSLTCLGFVPQGLGDFTRLELTWFIIYHTKRHTQQLDKISKILAGKSWDAGRVI
jgi:hypothetical protein